MGASSSKELSTTYEADRRDIMSKTNNTQFICDKILNYMLKDINISDFLLLANKRECSRYVIFLANTIDQRFRVINIVPSKGPGGRLYFKPGKEVVEPKPEEIKERQSLCIFLAYFYVRIFQILGAIMLTVIDDVDIHVKSGDVRRLVEDEIQQMRNPALGAPLGAPAVPLGKYLGVGGPIRPYREKRGLFRGGDGNEEEEEEEDFGGGGNVVIANIEGDSIQRIQSGGAIPSNFIYLEDLVGSRTERIPTGTGTRDRDGYVFRNISGMAFVPGPSSTFLGQGGTASFYIRTNNTTYPVYEIVVKSEKDRDVYRMRIEKVRYRDSDAVSREEGKRIIYDILEREDAKIERDDRDRWYVHEQGGEEITLLEFLKELRQKVDSHLGIRRAGQTRRDDDDDHRRGRSDSDRDKRRDDVEDKLRYSESETDPALRVTKMLTALRNTQPLAHCVARGIQLLGTQVQGVKGTFHSTACDSKFHLISDGIDSRGRETEIIRDALPKPGESIDKIPGLSVLAQLFYDFVQIKATTIMRSREPKDNASYVDFMRKMIKVFDGKDYTGPVDTLLKTNLSSVKDQASQRACAVIGNDTDIVKGTATGNSVFKIVRQLFGTQIQHAARCGELLKQLFLIQQNKQQMTIQIHPNVMLKGFPELDRINRNARAILVDYYSKCEGLYKTGLQALEVQHLAKQQKQVPVPAGTGRPGIARPGVAGIRRPGGLTRRGVSWPNGRTNGKIIPGIGGAYTATRKNRSIL
jgi:hypothetical protein